MRLFTDEELEELRKADAEIEKEFELTAEEREWSDQQDRRFGDTHRREQGREYYQRNREQSLAYAKAYRESHKEYYRKHKREYYQKHSEELRAKQREYYKAHREQILAKQRERNRRYYQENKSAIKHRRDAKK